MTQHNSRLKDNDVQGDSNGIASSGRDSHVRQVATDRNPTTVRENKKQIKISTWNVRTLMTKGKLDNIKREMTRMEINIMGLCEVRWTGAGVITSDHCKIIYSGGDKHERGVGIILDNERGMALKGYWAISDRVLLVRLNGKPFDISVIQVYAPTSNSTEEEVETFYNELELAKSYCKSQDILIVQGDFNAKVGNQSEEKTAGPYGLGERNERGEKLIEWATVNNMMITNTWFKQHPRRQWTWKSPGGEVKNQIDYILINTRFRNSILCAKSVPGADCYSDHIPVSAKIRLKLKKLKKPPRNIKLDLATLKNNSEIRKKYLVAVKNKFALLEDIQDIDEKWTKLKEAITESVEETVPKMQKKAKKKWMTQEILDLMDIRRANKHNTEEYEKIHKQIITKCNEAKQIWLDEKCQEIENIHNQNPADIYKRIKDITNRKSHCSSGCIKAKDGNIIMEKEKILERWSEYIGELYNDDRPAEKEINTNFEGPPILEGEVKQAMERMKTGKAAGPDKITIEMLEPLEEMGISVITNFLNEIYCSGQIPPDISKSIFIALPKKPAATECELHRTISLMSHITKILLRILMMRARKRLKPEIAGEQCGFVEGKGTANAIYILRTLIERSLEVQKDLYLCFIDYTKAFDRVRHVKIIDILEGLNIDGKDLRVIRNIYWEQTAAVRVDNEISDYQHIKRGVRQGCVLSPDLFSIYSENIMRNIENLPGISTNGYNMNNIRYADDIVLIAESEKDLQVLVNIIEQESEKMGLSLNTKKTVTMAITRKSITPSCNIKLDGKELAQVEKFKYLGALITADGRCLAEIKSRICQAKATFQNMRHILTNKKLPLDLRKRILQCYVEPVLLYACETWTLNAQTRKQLEATEMWFLRRLMKISWTEMKSNEVILKEAKARRTLINKIRKRHATFFGHVMRRGGLEHLVTTGKINGKRSRGRQRIKSLDNLTTWLRTSGNNATIRATESRDSWRAMVANAFQHGT